MTTRDHVRRSTSAPVNQEIRERTLRSVDQLRGDPERMRLRLHEIDAEWNIERALETLSSSLSLGGLALGLSGRRRWLGLPIVVQTFLLQHAVQGWCPPLPLLRRLGYRTQQEIERERYTIRALVRDQVHSGDTDRPAELPAEPKASKADRAAPDATNIAGEGC